MKVPILKEILGYCQASVLLVLLFLREIGIRFFELLGIRFKNGYGKGFTVSYKRCI